MVVAETVTGAPAASDSAACASARRGPIFGRLPITWTATLPISNPASRTRRAASASRRTPLAPAHAGSAVPKLLPRSPRPAAENSASQQACAATSPSEWPGEAPGLVGEVQPGHVQRDAVGQGVHVGADAGAGKGHPAIMP